MWGPSHFRDGKNFSTLLLFFAFKKENSIGDGALNRGEYITHRLILYTYLICPGEWSNQSNILSFSIHLHLHHNTIRRIFFSLVSLLKKIAFFHLELYSSYCKSILVELAWKIQSININSTTFHYPQSFRRIFEHHSGRLKRVQLSMASQKCMTWLRSVCLIRL